MGPISVLIDPKISFGLAAWLQGTDKNAGAEGADEYFVASVPVLGIAKPEPRRSKLAKVRKQKAGLKLHAERASDQSGHEPCYLPPGTTKEYFEQCKALNGGAAFSTFWRTWRVEFPFLKFRGWSSHAQCATCVHHRILMKELAPFLQARTAQANLFHQHLMSQYRDRLCYWSWRGSSRLRAFHHVVIIQDGMDQQKFCWPRSRTMLAKDLTTLQRPKLSVIGVIVHGFMLLMSVSNPDHPKDSSCMAELLCHVLTRLSQQGLRLEDTTVHLFADNTSRETKNSATLRLLTALTQRRALPQVVCGSDFETIPQTQRSLFEESSRLLQ